MTYQPITCVWEVTMGCNMRCKHCGSSCETALPDELNTVEALSLCDQIADLGLVWITISGGEPLTRKDLPRLIERLRTRGVSVNLITNGWLLNEETARTLKQSGIATVAISIDGTEEIHDNIRKPQAYAHAREAFRILKENGITTGAITTLSKQNLGILADLKEELIAMKVDSWQVQIGLPMGNLKERPDWVLDPEQINHVIDFCYRTAKERRIKIFPADCIGYCTKKEMEIKRIAYETNEVQLWNGCNAGIRGFGVLHNGDILGCTSIRSREFVEGNIRNRSLREIWEDENGFQWRRSLTKQQLSGKCQECIYGSRCLGGCPNTRLTMKGSIYEENEYCSYHLELKQLSIKYQDVHNPDTLFQEAQEMIEKRQYQKAAFALARVIELSPEHMDAYLAKGYSEYMCGNYELCRQANEKALSLKPEDAYALRGYAIAVYKMGKREEGVKLIRKAAELTRWQDRDILEDMQMMEMN